MQKRERRKGEKGEYYFPIPAGTPYSVIAEATHKYNVQLTEREMQTPEGAGNVVLPKIWVLTGEKKSLVSAKNFIVKRMQEMLQKFE